MAADFESFAIVEVDWTDSAGAHGWEQKKERLNGDRAAHYCRSVGYLIEDTDQWLTVALSLAMNGLVDCCITIPKFAITARRMLKEAASAAPRDSINEGPPPKPDPRPTPADILETARKQVCKPECRLLTEYAPERLAYDIFHWTAGDPAWQPDTLHVEEISLDVVVAWLKGLHNTPMPIAS